MKNLARIHRRWLVARRYLSWPSASIRLEAECAAHRVHVRETEVPTCVAHALDRHHSIRHDKHSLPASSIREQRRQRILIADEALDLINTVERGLGHVDRHLVEEQALLCLGVRDVCEEQE